MEKHSSDTHANDSQSSGFAEIIKSNTTINFSVESILSSESRTKKVDTDHFHIKSFDNSSAPTKILSNEDLSRIYRPMPMRPLPNAALFQGKFNLCTQKNILNKKHIRPIEKNCKKKIIIIEILQMP